MSLALHWIAPVAILAYALVGGVFLAFSDFIMRALAKTGGAGGPEAMQSVNREVFRWIFMTLFIGLAPLSLAMVVLGASGAADLTIAAAGLVYLLGCFIPTVIRNVPMNDALAALDPTSQEAQAYWRETYLPRWTFWNSVRTIACILAAAVLLAGLAPPASP